MPLPKRCFVSRAIKNLAECAEQYGNGTVTFTTRLTVEIPGIPFEHIDDVRNHVAKQNMTIGERAQNTCYYCLQRYNLHLWKL